MKSAACPSCGAPVAFRSSASVYAVCAFCRSTLLRAGDDLRNLGRMADLMDDPSRLQIGSEGTFRGVHFAIIGRIQLKYDAGLWNEWHLLFDDQRSAWLSEAGGEYVVSAQMAVKETLPDFAALAPDMPLTIAGHRLIVSDLESARCIAGEGELPFKVESGYDVCTADLRGNERLVTIDYSETPPLVFVGYPAQFAELRLVNLRAEADAGTTPQLAVRAFNCPHCAAPLSVHSAAIARIACAGCGSLIGIDNENVQLLARAAQALRYDPWLPLGSRGTLQGVAWEVIGYLRRCTRCDGGEYTWSEYLLFGGEQGFAWLIEYQGHWNFARTLAQPPLISRGQPSFQRREGLFKRFSCAEAEVTYVLGEFYWRVAVGERCQVEDYICPPYVLTHEVSDKEASWSQSEYLEASVVAAAFAVKAPLPARIGVYANQPNPRSARHRSVLRMFVGLAVVATVLQCLFLFGVGSPLLLRQQLTLLPQEASGNETTFSTTEFVLPGRVRSLRVSHRTDVDNNWVGLNTTLVEKNTGEAYQGTQEISYYRGTDDGESWSEGKQADAIAFRDVPPGTYYLVIDCELGNERNEAVHDTVEVARNPASWSNYLLLLVALLLFPIFSYWRKAAFEEARWRESDVGGASVADGAAGAGDD